MNARTWACPCQNNGCVLVGAPGPPRCGVGRTESGNAFCLESNFFETVQPRELAPDFCEIDSLHLNSTIARAKRDDFRLTRLSIRHSVLLYLRLVRVLFIERLK
jgi:hypothetical protein